MIRLRAAWHEIRCRECRVTWSSWWQRLVGNPKGMNPMTDWVDVTRARHLATAITLRETREYVASHGTDGLAEWLLRRENAYLPDDVTDEEMQR